MPTLNSKLQQTSHRSVLRRKASRLGLQGADDFIRVAVDRGCHHFRGAFRSNSESCPVPAQLSDDMELPSPQQVESWKKMTLDQKLNLLLLTVRQARNLTRAGIRMRLANAKPLEIERELARLWLHARP